MHPAKSDRGMSLMDRLKRLIRNAPKKIFLILDNLRVHQAKLVHQRIEESADKLEVFFLPCYSPELSPDELLNADLKRRATATVPARARTQLFNTTSSAQKQPARVERDFHHPARRYAAWSLSFRAGSIRTGANNTDAEPTLA
jgi:transposase